MRSNLREMAKMKRKLHEATNDFRAGLVTSMLVSGGGSGGGAGPGVSATKEHLAGIIDEVGTRCTHCNEHLRVPR